MDEGDELRRRLDVTTKALNLAVGLLLRSNARLGQSATLFQEMTAAMDQGTKAIRRMSGDLAAVHDVADRYGAEVAGDRGEYTAVERVELILASAGDKRPRRGRDKGITA